MKKLDTPNINFFNFVKGDDEEMMVAIFGRKNIEHENATLPGYELCIQTAKDITDKVVPNSPIPISPRALLTKKRGQNFELFTIRPNRNKNVRGTVWYVSNEEYEKLRNYELIEAEMSEDIVAKAITDNGETITVSTYGLDKNIDKITKVVDENYQRPEIPKEEKIKTATEIRN